jgi:spore maturation protein CgeB
VRILYVGMADDYGDPSRGPSFEELNFRSSLEGMGHEVVAFDFMARMKRDGTEAMRKDLVELAAETQPDLSFFLLFTDELDAPTIRAVGRAGGAPTVNWFADDHWRFEGFSRHLAPAFDLAVTTDPDALPKYRAAGIGNVHLSQWACNRYAYSKVTDAIEHEVTFVGQPHGDRRAVIDRLRAAGHRVECWGFGWSLGRIDNAEMVRVFSSSRVNLNLSNSSTPDETLRMRVGRWLGRGPAQAPVRGPRPPQIKGRNFEVPGCGGFLLTERVPHLERYFELDREVGVFTDADDLVEKVGYWLADEDERAAVAAAGHRRVLAEHTYDHRFAAIFRALELEDRARSG